MLAWLAARAGLSTGKLAALAVAAAVIFAAGFGSAWRVQGWRCAAEQKAAIEKAIDEYRGEVARAAAASGALARKEENVRVQTRVIRQNVDRIVTVYRDRPCLDDDGVRAANAALGAPAAAGQPDGAVPAADAARGRDGRDGPAQAGGRR